LPPKQALPLVRPSFSPDYLMETKGNLRYIVLSTES
jgi:hypothetical protein